VARVGDAFDAVFAAVREADAGPSYEGEDRGGDEHLVGSGFGLYSLGDVVPGTQLSLDRANASSRRSRSADAGGPSYAGRNPDVCSITCSTVTRSLPLVPNSRMYSATPRLVSRVPSLISSQAALATNAWWHRR
jgi:hypothetical protein